MRILVLGIGNEILTDDGVGPRVVEEARKRWFGDGVCFETTFQAGMTLVDLITGYDTLIIVDALQTGGKPGELYRLTPEDMQIPNTAPVPEHRIGILRALELGRSLGLDMPERVEILAIEAADVTSFGEGLTPGVAASIPGAVREVLSLLTGLYSSYGASRQEPKSSVKRGAANANRSMKYVEDE